LYGSILVSAPRIEPAKHRQRRTRQWETHEGALPDDLLCKQGSQIAGYGIGGRAAISQHSNPLVDGSDHSRRKAQR